MRNPENVKIMARPVTRPVKLKDGFYIEVKNKGASSGVKIRRSTKEQIKIAMKRYKNTKDVNYIGEVKDGSLVGKS